MSDDAYVRRPTQWQKCGGCGYRVPRRKSLHCRASQGNVEGPPVCTRVFVLHVTAPGYQYIKSKLCNLLGDHTYQSPVIIRVPRVRKLARRMCVCVCVTYGGASLRVRKLVPRISKLLSHPSSNTYNKSACFSTLFINFLWNSYLALRAYENSLQ